VEGIDQLCHPDAERDRADPFPRRPERSPKDANSSSEVGAGEFQSETLCAGDLIATHVRLETAINVNTAPRPLLEAAARATGRDNVAGVMASRAKGRFVRLGALAKRDGAEPSVIQLVGSSDVWSFRIDVRVGPVQKSRWCVYVKKRTFRDDNGAHESEQTVKYLNQWECVQRLAIQ